MSRPPSKSDLPECCKEQQPCCRPGGRIPQSSRTGISRIPATGGVSKITVPGARGSRIGAPSAGVSRLGPPGVGGSRPASAGSGVRMTREAPVTGVTKVVTAITRPHPSGGTAIGVGISKTTIRGHGASARAMPVGGSKSIPEVRPARVARPIAPPKPPEPPRYAKPVRPPGQTRAPGPSRPVGPARQPGPAKPPARPPVKKQPLPKPAPSRVQRFDKSINEELERRRHPKAGVQLTSSDPALVEAAGKLARAEAADSWAGAVKAAEDAADAATPTTAEEAATEAVRNFQAEILDVVHETVPGFKPIQVLGYVGITKPKYPAR